MASHLDFELGFGKGGQGAQRKDTDPMRILLMADFSGRANRGVQDFAGLSERPTPRVDVEN